LARNVHNPISSLLKRKVRKQHEKESIMLNPVKTFACVTVSALALVLSPASKVMAEDMFAGEGFGETIVDGVGPGMVDFDQLEMVGNILRVGLIPGRDLNGRELNRPLDGGALLQAVSVFGAAHPFAQLFEVFLDGSAVLGASDQGILPPIDMVGAVLEARLEDGRGAAMRIDGFMVTSLLGFTDVFLYEVSYIAEGMETFEPLCGVEEDGAPILAIALAGTWDLGEGVPGGGSWIEEPGSFTFACRRYALAKCVEAGYAPWAEPELNLGGMFVHVPLRPNHQACTRMMRADYCGDGTSYTVNGTAVNFYDDLGIRVDSEPWFFEAEWGADGALCAATSRIVRNPPHCAPDLNVPGCGSFGSGALLMSEVDR
jgi:hypothetical protein